jgi:hypothetical protein
MLLDLVIAYAEASDNGVEMISRLEESLNVEDWSQYEVSEK